MPLLCPYSREPIQAPVCYGGYIYEENSLLDAVFEIINACFPTEKLHEIKRNRDKLKQTIAELLKKENLSEKNKKQLENVQKLIENYRVDQYTAAFLEFFKKHASLILTKEPDGEYTIHATALAELTEMSTDCITSEFPENDVILSLGSGCSFDKSSVISWWKNVTTTTASQRLFEDPSNRTTYSPTSFISHPLYTALMTITKDKKEKEITVLPDDWFAQLNKQEFLSEETAKTEKVFSDPSLRVQKIVEAQKAVNRFSGVFAVSCWGLQIVLLVASAVLRGVAYVDHGGPMPNYVFGDDICMDIADMSDLCIYFLAACILVAVLLTWMVGRYYEHLLSNNLDLTQTDSATFHRLTRAYDNGSSQSSSDTADVDQGGPSSSVSAGDEANAAGVGSSVSASDSDEEVDVAGVSPSSSSLTGDDGAIDKGFSSSSVSETYKIDDNRATPSLRLR